MYNYVYMYFSQYIYIIYTYNYLYIICIIINIYIYICANNRNQSSLTMVFAMSFPQISPPKFSVHPHLVLVAHPCNLYALGRSMQLLTSGDKLVKVDQAILVAVNQTKKGCKILQQQDRCDQWEKIELQCAPKIVVLKFC